MDIFLSYLVTLGLSSPCLAYDFFGTKTSYFVNSNPSPQLPPEIAGCTPKLLWNMARHGSRNPGDDDILEMANRLPNIRDELVAAWVVGDSQLSEETIGKFVEWTFNLTLIDDSMLTESGWKEHQEMGERWRERLIGLLEFSKDSTQVRSSSKQRCVDSADAFLHGLFDTSSRNYDSEEDEFEVLPTLEVVRRKKRETENW